MSSWREEVDQCPYKWAWRKQRRLEGEGEILGESLNVQCVLRHREGNTNRRSLERVVQSGPVLEGAGGLQIQVQRPQKQPYTAHSCQACALFAGQKEALQRMSSSRWKHAKINWRGGSLQ